MIRVLVADDEALERAALLKILGSAVAQEPLEIVEAGNGIDALEAAKRAQPDIAFLDIRMPGLDGLEVVRALSEFSSPPEIVMITAYDHFGYAREALRFGVREYLLKPASASDVLNALQKALRAIIQRREESEHRRTARGITEDLKNTLKDSIEADLAEGNIDLARLKHYVSLQSPTHGAWVGIALAAGMRVSSTAAAQASVAALAFPRAFSALVRRYLAEDLGLSYEYCAIFTSANGAVSAGVPHDDVVAHTAPEVIVFLLVFDGGDTHGVPDSSAETLLCQAEKLATTKMHTFYARCVDAHLGTLGFGLSAGGPESVDRLVATAKTALDLSSAHMPLLFLRPMPPYTSLNEHANKGLYQGALSSRALAWLKEHFAQSIGIETASQALGVSPSHLSRVLKKEIGLSFGETLVRIRVAQAKNLLASGLSAKEASLLAGFRDQSYFTKVFQKREGILPSEFRAIQPVKPLRSNRA